jgi:sugar lactone lactonase YvrE
VLDDKYAYYTDHFSYVLGRLDRTTGEVTETPFDLPSGAGRDEGGGDGRAGNPGGGAHDVLMDKTGKVLIGMDDGIVRFDPATEKFQSWTSGSNMFGLDPNGNVWHTAEGGTGILYNVNTTTGDVAKFTVPKNDGDYDVDTDSKGRTLTNVWREGKIAVFDPKTESYNTYPLPTPESGPRRGQIDAQDRLWVAQYYSGSVAMFDPNSGGPPVNHPPVLGAICDKLATTFLFGKPLTFGSPGLHANELLVGNPLTQIGVNGYQVKRIDRFTGQQTMLYQEAQPYPAPSLLVLDCNGLLFATSPGTEKPSALFAIDPDTWRSVSKTNCIGSLPPMMPSKP